MAATLLVDCYLDQDGCASNYAPFYGGGELEVARAIEAELPSDLGAYEALIVSGSAASALDEPEWLEPLEQLLRSACERAMPVLGVCFGHQVLARARLGSSVLRRAKQVEFGWKSIEIERGSPLLGAHAPRFTTFVSHSDELDAEASAFKSSAQVFARSNECAVHAYQLRGLPAFGVQFHAEMGIGEAAQLVNSRTAKHPEWGLCAADLLAQQVDSAPLFASLLGDFRRVVKAGK